LSETNRKASSDCPGDPLSEYSLFRILDAAANRCREGLRAVEDYARMHLNDAGISFEIKEIRHILAAVLNQMGQSNWVRGRDTLHDVGTQSTLDSEQFRGTLQDVLRANLKRVEESLRSLEEYGKILKTDRCEVLARCRYRMYTVEKMLETVLSARERLRDRRLCLLVAAAACRRGLEVVVRESVAAGVDLVQVREKNLGDCQLVEELNNVRVWTAEAGALLIVNDRPDLAAVVGADGVHLGQDDLPVHEARRILPNQLIGRSTHSSEQASAAMLAGADYLGVGPVFPSRTKEFSQLAGLDYVQKIAKGTAIPWFAIGGITLENLSQVRAAGATRIAVSREICAAEDPGQIAREFLKRLNENSPAQGS
jgi:thiamine-phosphate pyrophosphorylase